MKYNIEFSEYAFETYDAITDQLQARWGFKILNDFEERVIKILETVQDTPFLFQAIDNNEKIRKAVIHRNCSVFL